MKQIHLNILLPVALIASLAAAAAVFVVPLPVLNAQAEQAGTNPNPADPSDTSNNSPDALLPKIEPQDWNALADKIEDTRVAPILSITQIEPDEEDETPTLPKNAQLNALQWAYVGNIVEPARVVACVEIDGKQSWFIEGQTVSATAGLQPFDVTVQAVSEQELTIEYEGATRTFSIQSTTTGDFELAT
jgi:hypothetical protein